MPIDLTKLRADLLSRRDELDKLDRMSKEARQPVELDQASVGRLSRMDAMQQQAMAIESERRRELDRRRIDAALKRIESGEYGFCTRCGEEIAKKRLDLDPTVPTCIGCAGAQ